MRDEAGAFDINPIVTAVVVCCPQVTIVALLESNVRLDGAKTKVERPCFRRFSTSSSRITATDIFT